MRLTCLLTILIAWPSALLAGDAIINVRQLGVVGDEDTGRYALAAVVGALPETSSCATNLTQVTFPLNTEIERLNYTTLLTATATGLPVYLVYSDFECPYFGRPLGLRVHLRDGP